MKIFNVASITALGLFALGTPGCLEADSDPVTLDTVQATGEPLNDQARSSTIRFRLRAFTTQVRQVRYEITNNKTGEIIRETVMVKPELSLPGGISSLEKRPLDKHSQHPFTDLFKALAPGSYGVTVTPLGEAGASLQGRCFGSSRNPIIAREGKTVEVILMVQCKSQNAAALDVLAGINHAPSLTNLEFERVGSAPNDNPNSPKFSCSNTLRFCAQAKDQDNDPLTFVVDAPKACTVRYGSKPSYPPQVPGSELAQCFELECPDRFRGRRIDFSVSALDMAWRDGQVVSMESILRSKGMNLPSRGVIDSFGYLLSNEACNGGGNDCNTTPGQVPAALDILFLQELSKSMAKHLGPIRSQIPAVIKELTQRNPSSENNGNDCANQGKGRPRVALASFIDKPFGIFGSPKFDYVYREHLVANASSSNRLEAAYASLKTGLGAGAAEAQIEALLAAAQNMQRLGFGQQRSGPRYAVLITNSKFHQAGDCPTDTAAPVCRSKNNLDGVIDPQEDYPYAYDVVKTLRDNRVYPIFVLIDGDTPAEARTQYTEFFEQTKQPVDPNAPVARVSVPGAVVYFNPKEEGSLGRKIRNGISQIEARIKRP